MKKNLVAWVQKLRELEDSSDSRSGIGDEAEGEENYTGSIERLHEMGRKVGERQKKQAREALNTFPGH